MLVFLHKFFHFYPTNFLREKILVFKIQATTGHIKLLHALQGFEVSCITHNLYTRLRLRNTIDGQVM